MIAKPGINRLCVKYELVFWMYSCLLRQQVALGVGQDGVCKLFVVCTLAGGLCGLSTKEQLVRCCVLPTSPVY